MKNETCEFKLAKILANKGRYFEAIKRFKECQEIYLKQRNIVFLALTVFELGHIYHQTGNLEEARLYFKDSIRLFRRLKDEDNIAVATIALGNLEIQIGKIPQAKEHLLKAREYFQDKNNEERLAEINYLLEIIYWKLLIEYSLSLASLIRFRKLISIGK